MVNLEEINLVVGNGFLGSYIVNELKNQELDVIHTNFSPSDKKNFLDIRDINSIRNFFNKFHPTNVFNCAAAGKIDFLETNPEIAYSINSDGAKNLAIVSKEYNSKLIHISSDSIFDGNTGMYNENDLPNPLNVYAKSKVKAEEYLQEINCDHVIVRTNFYGFDSRGNWFFNWVYNQFVQKNPIIGFNDVIFNPLEISNISTILVNIASNDFSGIINIASKQALSKCQFILMVADIFGFDNSLVLEGSYRNYSKATANRPLNTSLDIGKFLNIFNYNLLSYDKSLKIIKKRLESDSSF